MVDDDPAIRQLLTAAAEPDTAVRAWGDGVDYFLAKPFDSDEVLDLVDRLVGENMPTAELQPGLTSLKISPLPPMTGMESEPWAPLS